MCYRIDVFYISNTIVTFYLVFVFDTDFTVIAFCV